MPYGRKVELWVDEDEFSKGKSPEIWQLIINDKMMMSRDSISELMFKRAQFYALIGIAATVVGAILMMLLKSKNPWITEKLYPKITISIQISLLLMVLYFTFFEIINR